MTIFKERGDRHQVLRAIQATYESQNTEVSREVAKALFVDGKIMLRDMPLTAVDLLGIIFSVESHEQISEMWWVPFIMKNLKIRINTLLKFSVLEISNHNNVDRVHAQRFPHNIIRNGRGLAPFFLSMSI